MPLPAPPSSHPDPQPTPPAKTSWKQKVWTVIDVIGVRLRFILLMVLVGVIAAKWDTIMNYYDRWTRPTQAPDLVQAQDVEYYCGMHPNIIRDQPGKCPICGMPLIKRAKTHHRGTLPDGVLAQVQLTPQKVEMGRIGTRGVEYRLLTREVRTVGTVDYNETRRAVITSRLKGRLDKLLVNFVGQKVKKGDPLAEIYSPDLLVAQEELLSAVRTLREQKEGSMAADSARAVVEAARKKLALWGISEPQIEAVIARGTPQTHVTIFAPIAGIVTEKNVLEGKYVTEGDNLYTIADLGSVWMQAKIFESEIEGIREGTAVEVTTTAYPNELFAGRITFVAYTVDPDTRTVAARVEVLNPDYKLKPGMFVTAVVRLPMGQVVVLDDAAHPTTQPATVTLPHGLTTHGVVHAYLALAAALARDKTDPAAVAALMAETETLAEHAPNLSAATQAAAQAKTLAGGTLESQRAAFQALSDSMIQLLRIAPAQGMSLYIAHCPMAQADWITASNDEKGKANPYQGTDMLTCGSITGPLEPAVGPAGAGTDGGRFVTGYYCPIYPDRLYDQPEHCPIDKFPLKYVRAEKVLAVPESAVIDTGTRRVVYREAVAGSGTFDMLEVKLGPRTGEFYPVVSGLQPGDRVATQGAFLVDAENRLNPAAGAQFFGASSNPQPAGHQH
jgi:RND family efflux transporter MFP subunit